MTGFDANAQLGHEHVVSTGGFALRRASCADLTQGIGADREAGTLHYINSGRFEGRSASFDPAQYLANYADLAAGFGNSHEPATLHCIQHGFHEGRTDQPL